jgi:protein TonB
MKPLLHALNIGTLATWLSVACFGAVAVAIPKILPTPAARPEPEITRIPEDFTLGNDQPEEPESVAENASTEAPSQTSPELLPAPPELPEIQDFAPLPVIPELPAPSPRRSPAAAATPPKATNRPSQTGKTSPPRSSPGRPGGSPGASPAGTSGSAMSDASRLAKGRMPAPSYPSLAKRNNQTGTVIVEFTVDESGRVISAYAKSPSPWPLLNDEAVRTVRRWKFPPGGVMKLQRPIVFQLR